MLNEIYALWFTFALGVSIGFCCAIMLYERDEDE